MAGILSSTTLKLSERELQEMSFKRIIRDTIERCAKVAEEYEPEQNESVRECIEFIAINIRELEA